MNYWDTNVLSGLIGFVGSIIGGVITMWGVNKTLKVQNKEKFKDDFPLKIKNLDSIIEELIRINEKNGYKYHYLFENLYKARPSNKPKIDDKVFARLIEMSIYVDGEVYKKIRILIDNYISKFDDAKEIYDRGIIIFEEKDALGRPLVRLSEQATQKVDNIIDNLLLDLNELISFLKNHKEGLEKTYFKN